MESVNVIYSSQSRFLKKKTAIKLPSINLKLFLQDRNKEQFCSEPSNHLLPCVQIHFCFNPAPEFFQCVLTKVLTSSMSTPKLSRHAVLREEKKIKRQTKE